MGTRKNIPFASYGQANGERRGSEGSVCEPTVPRTCATERLLFSPFVFESVRLLWSTVAPLPSCEKCNPKQRNFRGGGEEEKEGGRSYPFVFESVYFGEILDGEKKEFESVYFGAL